MVPAGLTGVTAIAAGARHNVALKSNGTVVAWGDNYSNGHAFMYDPAGQTDVPVGLTGVTAIAAGESHTVALKHDGTATATATFVIGKAPQTIEFADIGDTLFPADPIQLSASASSGLGVTFSVVSGPATVSGSKLTLTGAGTVTVLATQLGDENYLAATSVTHSFVNIVNLASGSIVYDNTAKYLGYYTDQGNAIVGDEVNLEGTSRFITGIKFEYYLSPATSGNERGTLKLYANDGKYGLPSTLLYAGESFGLSNGFHTVNASDLSVLVTNNFTWALGISGLENGEKGGLLFYDEPTVGWSYNDFWSNKGGKWELRDTLGMKDNFGAEITAVSLVLRNLEHTYDGTAKLATALTIPSGLTVNLTYNGLSTAPTNVGTYTVIGTLDDVNYSGTVIGVMEIAQAVQTIQFAGIADVGYSDAPIGLVANASSGLGVTFGVVSGPVTVSGSTLRLTGMGTVTVVASQTGNVNFNPAKDVKRTFNVKKLAVVALSNLVHVYDGKAKLATVTTDPAGLAVTVTYDGIATPPVAPGSYKVEGLVGTPLVAWGHDGQGQTTVPEGLTGVTAIAAGDYRTVALKGDGTVVAWGANWYGQTTVPKGLTRVTAIAGGYSHTVSLKIDGTVVAWGNNWYGQITVPVGLVGVTAIAAGDYHTVALKIDGTVVAWGYNGHEQATVPVGLTGVTAIAAGEYHTVALKNDGTVVVWGYNGHEQATVPQGLTGVTAIAAGDYHTVALKDDGTVVAWGANWYGQTTVPEGLTGVTAIAGGYAHTVALKSDGTVETWGDNVHGQTTVPEGLTGVTAIAAGDFHTVALRVANTEYAGTATATLVISKAPQTIEFAEIPDAIYSTTPIELSASASSGLGVTFSVVSGPATVSGSTLTLTGVGTVTVMASQAGNANHEAATVNPTRTFAVIRPPVPVITNVSPAVSPVVSTYDVALDAAAAIHISGVEFRPIGDSVALDAATAIPDAKVDKTSSGFTAYVHRARNDANLLNSTARAEAQLRGYLLDPLTGAPFVNLADDASFGPGQTSLGDHQFSLPIINLDQTLVNYGNFHSGSNPSRPESQFPGLDPAIGYSGLDYFAVEFIGYLELPQGNTRMGVHSDDGFLVTSGADPRHPSATKLGEFSGGRGPGESTFNVYAPVAGIYAFRLIYEEGWGQAECEFFTFRQDGTKVLVNDREVAGAIKSYRIATPDSGTVPSQIPSAKVGQSFTFTITASNSPTSYGASNLPTGLSINSTTGVISGTPTTAGTYTITLSASNAGGTGTGTQMLTVSVAPLTLTIKSLKGVGFDFIFNGDINQVAVLEYSTDFIQWTPLATKGVGVKELLYFEALTPNTPYRFYRVIRQ